MKATIPLFLGIFCLAIASAAEDSAPPSPPGMKELPLVVADVNGQPIYRTELIRELVGSSCADALDRLVRRKLVEQGAKASGVSVTDDEIEQQFQADKRNLQSELIQMVNRNYKEFPIADLIQARFRLTLEEYKQNVVRQKLLVRRCMAKDLHPTDADLREFYDKYQNIIQPPTKYRASHILITPLDPMDSARSFRYKSSVSQVQQIQRERKRIIDLYRDHGIDLGGAIDNDQGWAEFKRQHPEIAIGSRPVLDIDPEWQAAKARAEEALRKIRSGTLTWNQAVREYTQDPLDVPHYNADSKQTLSQREWLIRKRSTELLATEPGEVGWFTADGPVVREFYEGAKDLKPGEIGGPFRTEFGYHLVRMLEVKQAPHLTFEESRKKVEDDYFEDQIQQRAEKWLQDLVDRANLETRKALLWPPAPKAPQIGITTADSTENTDEDPVIGSVNGDPIKRSEVWRELLRSDGDESLTRLINLEIVLGLLRKMGLPHLEWLCKNPQSREPAPPAMRPISVDPVALDLELNDERLRYDQAAQTTPGLTFAEHIYQRYGQNVDEFKRKLAAGLILRKAVNEKVPLDDATLRTEFALAKDFYREPVWYDISHILIVPTGGMDKADVGRRGQALEIANNVYYECKEHPNDFAQIAVKWTMDDQTRNSGGNLGPCYADDRNPNIPRGIYAAIEKQKLEPGQVSAPIQTSKGYHVVRVNTLHPSRDVLFDEVKGRLTRDYLNERAKMYTDIWLRALVRQAKVKRYLFPNPTETVDDLWQDNFTLPKK